MSSSQCIVQVALPIPLRRSFDYLVDKNKLNPHPGIRVLVPFGKKREQVGLIIKVTNKSKLEEKRLKYIQKTIDDEPLFSERHLELLLWASEYYQHPIGEVVFNSLPVLLRQGKTAKAKADFKWCLSAKANEFDFSSLKRAPNQTRILKLMREYPEGIIYSDLQVLEFNWPSAMNSLVKKGLVEKLELQQQTNIGKVRSSIQLNPQQTVAVEAIKASLNQYQCTLLNGVTGSGKTEVYIELVKQIIENGQQSLILVPEIGLTPQFVTRLEQQLNVELVVLHSALSENERLKNWLLSRSGKALVILGTRSAIWTPMKDPGLIIVDEEHDLSYKQQDGFRYSARDIAIMRGKLADIPVVLGSATPSMESLKNVDEKKFLELKLPERVGNVKQPSIKLIDMRAQPMTGALSKQLIQAIKTQVENGKQVLLFLNRRGFSPVMMCHQCGWHADCRRCEVPLTYHKQKDKLICHHCSIQSIVPQSCPECDSEELLLVGHGTERLSETLADIFPKARILRIDRDSTRRKGSMEALVETINAGEADILVGTQMLAKGHHFPKLTLVGIIDTDQGLFGTDFRASERMAQLFTQVSGRAGRAKHAGTVLVQTHYPEHLLLRSLIHDGYEAFSQDLLEERKHANLPPFSYLAMLRAEANQADKLEHFFKEAKILLREKSCDLENYGPVPAPIAKRAGRLRYQLLIQTNKRGQFKKFLGGWCEALEDLPSAKKVRWSLDIDPQDML